MFKVGDKVTYRDRGFNRGSVPMTVSAVSDLLALTESRTSFTIKGQIIQLSHIKGCWYDAESFSLIDPPKTYVLEVQANSVEEARRLIRDGQITPREV
jgi:hypothetical protein